jgi:hypothetical protein
MFYGYNLDEQQLAFANAIWDKDKDIIFCNSKAGTGKAQPVDTVIPRQTATKHSEIFVLAIWYSTQMESLRWFGVFNQGNQKAYKVTFNDGRSTICAGEHLWSYYGYGDKLVTETLNSMMQRSIIAGSRGLRYSIPSCKCVQYTTSEQFVDPYVMGVFLGDGSCSSKYLSLSSSDEEIVSEVASILGCEYKKNTDKNYSWSFYKDGQCVKTEDVFGKYPEVMTTCDQKRIPPAYIYADKEQRYNILQGLFDTDGGISIAESRFNVRYTSINKGLLCDMLKIVYSLGFTGILRKIKRPVFKRNMLQLSYQSANDFKENCSGFKEKRYRLQSTSQRQAEKVRRIAIRNIEDLGYECEMVCIYVDNKEHLYLTNDYIVTHNTTVATGVANSWFSMDSMRHRLYYDSIRKKTQGYLPGTITEKSSVYFEAFYQALVNCDINPNIAINTESMVNQKNGTGFITCITDTYLRGTNLDNAVVIIDEAQNYTVAQLKKTLTRVGSKAKVIVIGHDLQCDISNPELSGFTKYVKHFENEERAAVCCLTHNYRGW